MTEERGILEVSKLIYKILNVSSLTSIITGSIYRISKPIDSQLEDIVINSIGNLSSKEVTGVNNGLLNINIYVSKVNGFPNISRLDIIKDKVIQLIEESSSYQSANSFFIKILSTNLFTEQEQNTVNFYNIKLQINLN